MNKDKENRDNFKEDKEIAEYSNNFLLEDLNYKGMNKLYKRNFMKCVNLTWL